MTQVIAENIRSAVAPAAPKNQRVCRHFARGRCTWGTSCRFSHELDRQVVEEMNINSTFIRHQQQQLQKDRSAILKVALDGDFNIKPYNGDEFHRFIVHFPHPSSPIPITQLLSESVLNKQLLELEGNDQLRVGGLLYLVGEPTVFWSMMYCYRTNRTTTNSKWDAILLNAKRGHVECMFFRSPAGCLSNECVFDHNTTPITTITSPLQNMATNNALVTPLLGFDVTTTSATPSTTTNTGAINNNGINAGIPIVSTTSSVGLAAKAFIGGNGLRVPVDATRPLIVQPTLDKQDDIMMFRDPVWGTFATQERSHTQQQPAPPQQQLPQRQDGISLLWDSNARGLAEALW